MKRPDTDRFVIKFENTEGETVGKIIIDKDEPMKFEGDLDESAQRLFEHLKPRIDNYIVQQIREIEQRLRGNTGD